MTGSFVFYQKKASSMKQADLRNKLKKVSKSVCTSTIVVPPDLLFPTPSISSAIKTPENSEQDPDDPEPQAEGDIQIEYSSE
jgi:hypothetical protein